MVFRFHGEALDVNFVPSFMDVIESTLQSMRAFQELKKNILDVSESLRAENDNSYASTSVESASSSLAPFSITLDLLTQISSMTVVYLGFTRTKILKPRVSHLLK